MDRIDGSMVHLFGAFKILNNVEESVTRYPPLHETNFVEIMYLLIDRLLCYCNFKAGDIELFNFHPETSIYNIPLMCDCLTRQALNFANVALKEDKVALSALCQTVLRASIALRNSLADSQNNVRISISEIRLRATSLENAVYNLEDYLNEAQLRLVFHCFSGFSNFSIDRIKNAIATKNKALDELIADFDVNLDRATQIGMFAGQFAPNIKSKCNRIIFLGFIVNYIQYIIFYNFLNNCS